MNIERLVTDFYIKLSILYPENVDNLLESITDLINNEENPDDKTMIITVTVDQTFNGPREDQLVQLAATFSATSMIVIFTTENFDKFFINWKVKDSNGFYELEEIERKDQNLNSKEFYEFLVDFLIDCLSNNHSGKFQYFIMFI